jgi:DNA-binding NarL/FixJ family response regulator
MKAVKSAIKVLLADDHAVVRAGIRQFLEQSDDIDIVAEVDDGEAAKEWIAASPPDVALLDIKMPQASGIEVTRWIRSHHPDVGVLILTAYDDEPYVKAALQAGANGYVLKTASPGEIIRAVRDVHEGYSTLDIDIVEKVVSELTASDHASTVEALTDRELEVLTLVSKGYTNKAVGMQLDISDRTVQSHLAHIFEKMQVNSRTEAVMKAVSLGWLEPPPA